MLLINLSCQVSLNHIHLRFYLFDAVEEDTKRLTHLIELASKEDGIHFSPIALFLVRGGLFGFEQFDDVRISMDASID